METPFPPSTLICPYPLLEEEALAWAVLLFNQVYGLHPFPLSLTETVQNLMDQGRFRVRTPQRTQEEIRMKDRSLRDIQTFVAGLPDQGLLKYLNQARFIKDGETLDEITRSLRRESIPQHLQDLQAPSVLTGSILICLIHDWLIQEWAIDRSLARVEELETLLTEGWQEHLGERPARPESRPRIAYRPVKEIPCPLALGAWRILRETLFPEPFPLMTTQQWVWADYYGLDPGEGLTNSIPLPELGPFKIKEWGSWETQGKGEILRMNFAGLLRSLTGSGRQRAMAQFQESLEALGLPFQGRYRLILPPSPLTSPGYPGFSGPKGVLILLIPELKG